MQKQVQIAVILALFLGCQQGESPPQPDAGPPEGYVAKAEYEDLHRRFDQLLAEHRSKAAEERVRVLEEQLAAAKEEARRTTELLQSVAAEFDAADQKGIGLSLVRFARYFNKERGWYPTDFSKIEGGVQISFECKLKPAISVVLSGDPGNFDGLTVVLAGETNAMLNALPLGCELLEAIGPWSTDDIFNWMKSNADALEDGKEIAPKYRDGFRLGMASVLGSVVLHLKKEAPEPSEKSL